MPNYLSENFSNDKQSKKVWVFSWKLQMFILNNNIIPQVCIGYVMVNSQGNTEHWVGNNLLISNKQLVEYEISVTLACFMM